jgi:hypothetical protein
MIDIIMKSYEKKQNKKKGTKVSKTTSMNKLIVPTLVVQPSVIITPKPKLKRDRGLTPYENLTEFQWNRERYPNERL